MALWNTCWRAHDMLISHRMQIRTVPTTEPWHHQLTSLCRALIDLSDTQYCNTGETSSGDRVRQLLRPKQIALPIERTHRTTASCQATYQCTHENAQACHRRNNRTSLTSYSLYYDNNDQMSGDGNRASHRRPT